MTPMTFWWLNQHHFCLWLPAATQQPGRVPKHGEVHEVFALAMFGMVGKGLGQDP